MYNFSVVDLLQSSGPIALNELVMRMPTGPQEAVADLRKLQSAGKISISGPLAGKIYALTVHADPTNFECSVGVLSDRDILEASDTFIEPSVSSWRRSLAS